MKIRSDFVTNSSSSNYALSIIIEGKDGSSLSLTEDPFDYDSDQGGEVRFNKDLSELTADEDAAGSSVADLAQFLMEAIHSDLEDEWMYEEEDEEFDEEASDEDDQDEADDDEEIDDEEEADEEEEEDEEFDDEDDEFYSKRVLKDWLEERKEFIENAPKHFPSLDQIRSIEVTRRYDAWGEFACFLHEQDRKLMQLAKNAVEAEQGEARSQALAAFKEYIYAPQEFTGSGSIGTGFHEIRYLTYADDGALLALAKKITSHSYSRVVGAEVQKLDLEDGSFEKYIEWEL